MFILSASENILLFVTGFGLLQGISSAALLLFHPKSDKTVNRFLAFYLLTLTLPVIIPAVQHLFSWQIVSFIEPFITFSPVFLLFYVRSFKETITWQKAWPHFILFFVCLGLAIWIYAVIGSRFPLSDKFPDEAKKNMLLLTPFTIRLVQRVIYYFLARRALAAYHRSIVHLVSDTTRINLNWIKWLINGFIFLIFISIPTYFVMIRYPQYFEWAILVCGVIVALYVYMATFRGITQTTLWKIHPDIDQEVLEADLDKAAQLQLTDATHLSDQKPVNSKMQEIAERIHDAMEREKLYQEPELTLPTLANKLQYPSYQVSLAINEILKKTFYDLINGYRVEEAKHLLRDPKNENFTILSVGFEAGFNSKTTFNTVFKKFTGMTPTEFRDTPIVASA